MLFIDIQHKIIYNKRLNYYLALWVSVRHVAPLVFFAEDNSYTNLHNTIISIENAGR